VAFTKGFFSDGIDSHTSISRQCNLAINIQCYTSDNAVPKSMRPS